jgi:hypothetical protein
MDTQTVPLAALRDLQANYAAAAERCRTQAAGFDPKSRLKADTQARCGYLGQALAYRAVAGDLAALIRQHAPKEG